MTHSVGDVLSTAEARENLAEVMNRVAYGKERLVLTRRGRVLAALVPIEDVELLESLENEHDAQLIRERMAEWKSAGRRGTALEDYARGRDLEPVRASTED